MKDFKHDESLISKMVNETIHQVNCSLFDKINDHLSIPKDFYCGKFLENIKFFQIEDFGKKKETLFFPSNWSIFAKLYISSQNYELLILTKSNDTDKLFDVLKENSNNSDLVDFILIIFDSHEGSLAVITFCYEEQVHLNNLLKYFSELNNHQKEAA